MDAKIEGCRLSVNISDLLDNLSIGDKAALIDFLSCQDDIIKNVVDQVLHGCTESGSYGGTCFSVEPFTALDKARREVALKAGDVAKREVEQAISAMKWSKASEDRYSKWAFEMYHNWGQQSHCPSPPPHVSYDDVCQYEVIQKVVP